MLCLGEREWIQPWVFLSFKCMCTGMHVIVIMGTTVIIFWQVKNPISLVRQGWKTDIFHLSQQPALPNLLALQPTSAPPWIKNKECVLFLLNSPFCLPNLPLGWNSPSHQMQAVYPLITSSVNNLMVLLSHLMVPDSRGWRIGGW